MNEKKVKIQSVILWNTIVDVCILIMICIRFYTCSSNLVALVGDAVLIALVVLGYYIKNKMEVVDEFAKSAISKANGIAYKVLVICIVAIMLYAAYQNANAKIEGCLLAVSMVISFIVRLSIFYKLNKYGMDDYAKN
ncbi:hypothetical protein [Clostridium ljungdahlii]|uniref:Uncharacterized protein n=1 Tax=Clostridium ljungdahlii TaxID=1538 RepID=A0A168MP52_9CLOT|nr:hypothetical protein [Clostridium ljungdahlii]OAA84969.1 hypothetical protein WY13_02887 [Clostridium ljungdahlii]